MQKSAENRYSFSLLLVARVRCSDSLRSKSAALLVLLINTDKQGTWPVLVRRQVQQMEMLLSELHYSPVKSCPEYSPETGRVCISHDGQLVLIYHFTLQNHAIPSWRIVDIYSVTVISSFLFNFFFSFNQMEISQNTKRPFMLSDGET